jgi:hypothetical protein
MQLCRPFHTIHPAIIRPENNFLHGGAAVSPLSGFGLMLYGLSLTLNNFGLALIVLGLALGRPTLLTSLCNTLPVGTGPE